MLNRSRLHSIALYPNCVVLPVLFAKSTGVVVAQGHCWFELVFDSMDRLLGRYRNRQSSHAVELASEGYDFQSYERQYICGYPPRRVLVLQRWGKPVNRHYNARKEGWQDHLG
jgi:hypothetical protein